MSEPIRFPIDTAMRDRITEIVKEIAVQEFQRIEEDRWVKAMKAPRGEFVVAEETPTLRDQFAMAALGNWMTRAKGMGDFKEKNADWCYEIADALLEARKK